MPVMYQSCSIIVQEFKSETPGKFLISGKSLRLQLLVGPYGVAHMRV